MKEAFAIELTPEEQALLAAITFNAPRDHVDYQRNGEIALRLTQTLFARDAVAEHRMRYFNDAEYNPSNRKRSRQDGFVRNGCRGDDILKHGHFLPFLRYFIFGADLPDNVRDAFKAAVETCGGVTSGDIAPLANTAKALARQFGLKSSDVRDEFYKLALDCGLSESDAAAIRGAVMGLR